MPESQPPKQCHHKRQAVHWLLCPTPSQDTRRRRSGAIAVCRPPSCLGSQGEVCLQSACPVVVKIFLKGSLLLLLLNLSGSHMGCEVRIRPFVQVPLETCPKMRGAAACLFSGSFRGSRIKVGQVERNKQGNETLQS